MNCYHHLLQFFGGRNFFFHFSPTILALILVYHLQSLAKQRFLWIHSSKSDGLMQLIVESLPLVQPSLLFPYSTLPFSSWLDYAESSEVSLKTVFSLYQNIWTIRLKWILLLKILKETLQFCGLTKGRLQIAQRRQISIDIIIILLNMIIIFLLNILRMKIFRIYWTRSLD